MELHMIESNAMLTPLVTWIHALLTTQLGVSK
jgi:hypothetical protein